jgi:hypothetical protein
LRATMMLASRLVKQAANEASTDAECGTETQSSGTTGS